MELQELVGKHKLGGVDFSSERIEDGWYDKDSQVINFIIDGKTYTAIEDPGDGYRSCMHDIKKSNRKVENQFGPIEVMGKMRADDRERREINDVIEFIDVITGKMVLAVGTANTDEYYPYWVAEFVPENMCLNQERGKS